MRVIFTHHLTDGVSRLLMGLVGGIAHFVHTEKHTTVNGLHAVAHVGKGARHNHRHRIVDVGRFHLVFNIDLDDAIFFEHIKQISIKRQTGDLSESAAFNDMIISYWHLHNARVRDRHPAAWHKISYKDTKNSQIIRNFDGRNIFNDF